MIIFTGNFLNDAKLENPVTIVHYFDEETKVAMCSCHELREIEAALALDMKDEYVQLEFNPYNPRGYVKYSKPSETQEAVIRTIPLTFAYRTIERILGNGSVFFHKLPQPIKIQ